MPRSNVRQTRTDLKQLKSLSRNSSEDDLVFAHPKNPDRPMTEQNAIRCGLQEAAPKTGIHLTWHQLRHWPKTLLYGADVPIKVIQSRLGHSRGQTTAVWCIENHTEGGRAAADVASKLLDGWEK
jgi:integrase